MPNVPASAIPAAAWGISGRALDPEEIAALDPFAGRGVRLEVPDGRQVSIEDIIAAVGLPGVVLFPQCAWVDIRTTAGSPAIAEDLHARWQAWLAREEVSDST